MTFFLLIMQSGEAVQLLIVVNLAISLALVRRLWQDVDQALLIRLVIGAVAGLPVGLIVFQSADVDQLKILSAVTILTFVALVVFRSPRAADPTPAIRFRTPSAVGVGALAGGMTTALGMPGPAIVLYLTAVGAGRDATRSLSLTFFAVSYSASLVLQATTVGVGRGVWATAALLVPVAAVGALLGHALGKHVSESTFRRVVLALVASSGAYVLLDALLS